MNKLTWKSRSFKNVLVCWMSKRPALLWANDHFYEEHLYPKSSGLKNSEDFYITHIHIRTHWKVAACGPGAVDCIFLCSSPSVVAVGFPQGCDGLPGGGMLLWWLLHPLETPRHWRPGLLRHGGGAASVRDWGPATLPPAWRHLRLQPGGHTGSPRCSCICTHTCRHGGRLRTWPLAEPATVSVITVRSTRNFTWACLDPVPRHPRPSSPTVLTPLWTLLNSISVPLS